MNYYQYKRKAPRSKATDFIKPFLVIVLFAGIIFSAWRFLGPALKGGGETLSSEKVFLDIETGSARAMTSGDGEWKNVPTGIYLYESEKLRTQSDGRVSLNFFEKDTVRLDKSTEVEFSSLSRDLVGGKASLKVNSGRLWVIIGKNGSGVSEFTIDTGLLTLKTGSGTFALSHPGMLYVLSGSVKADILHEGSVVKTSTIGVGQELVVDEAIAADLAAGLSKEIIFAIDDAFKSSNWYRWNRQLDDTMESGLSEDSLPEIDEEDDELTEETPTQENKPEEDVDKPDKEPPDVPQIEEPGTNGQTVTLDGIEQDIKGSVSADTEAVIVNDYRLGKYVPGSRTFRYTAKVSIGNLKAGSNEFEVIAVDKAGNKSKAATITLILPQDVYDEAKAETKTDETTGAVPEATANGGVKITSPNDGENLVTSETAFEIRGTVPSESAKVIVNDYTLQGYTAGDSTFMYRASSTLGTLNIGKLNTYTVKAYDSENKLLGSATMTIDVEAAATGNGDPTITMPSTSSSYTTTLDQLVLGGTVGKWVENIYVNGEKQLEYIPGSESWKKSVELSPGENVFSVYGTKNGDSTATVKITINYQN